VPGNNRQLHNLALVALAFEVVALVLHAAVD
jgi:hypothetical protein